MSTATKQAWQDVSLLDLLEEERDAFTTIVCDLPAGTEFTVNDIRDRLDAAGVPVKARGGLFAKACRAGWIVAATITVHGQTYPKHKASTGESANGAMVRVYRRTAAPP